MKLFSSLGVIVFLSMQQCFAMTEDTAVPFSFAAINAENDIDGYVHVDIDGDGDLDFLVTGFDVGGIRVYENDGAGQFVAGDIVVAAEEISGSFRVFDVTGNGQLDIVSVNIPDGEIRVFEGNGVGGFTIKIVSQIPPQAVHSVKLGDVDGDGDPDLVGTNGSQSSVEVFHNDGQGLFSHSSSLECGRYPGAVDLADIDTDGDLDIGITNNTSPASFNDDHASVILNLGDGDFATYVQYLVGDKPTDIEFIDLSGDGILDLVVLTDDGLFRRDGFGDGTFSQFRHVTTEFGAVSFQSTDLDSDGDLDLVVAAGTGNGRVRVWYNNGEGGFPVSGRLAWDLERVHWWPIALGDFDGNSHADIAMLSDGMLYIYLQGSRGIVEGNDFARPLLISGGSDQSVLLSQDFDGDGFPEVVSSNDDELRVWSTNSVGAFDTVLSTTLVDGLESVVAGDFNSDGVPDFAGIQGENEPVVYLGDGNGGFTLVEVEGAFFGTANILRLADADSDGDLDLFMSTYVNSPPPERSFVFEISNDGAGVFTRETFYRFDEVAFGRLIDCVDMNNDSQLDLLVSGLSNRDLYVCYGTGDGGFGPFEHLTDLVQAISLIVADMNQDSVPEILTIPSSTATQKDVIHLWRLIDGQYQFESIDLGIGEPDGMGLEDIDGDGVPELLISLRVTSRSVFVFRISSSLEFQQWFTMPGFNYAYHSLDLGNDGDIDIIGYPDLRVFESGESFVPDCLVNFIDDGGLNFLDVSYFLENQVDLNDDGAFNFLDISLFLQLFSAGCP